MRRRQQKQEPMILIKMQRGKDLQQTIGILNTFQQQYDNGLIDWQEYLQNARKLIFANMKKGSARRICRTIETRLRREQMKVVKNVEN